MIDFPGAVPEVPVKHVEKASEYYRERLGFEVDWGDEAGGIIGISRGACRLFLTNTAFRTANGNGAPLVIWLNLGNRKEVDDLHEEWTSLRANLCTAPEAKPWKLYEFTARDLDGNLLRIFYDFAWEER